MCTRFSFDVNREKIKRQYNISFKQDLDRSYNIGPAQLAYVLTSNSEQLLKYHWGLIPYWSQDFNSGTHLTVAMIEGIESKYSFRMPVRYQRCVIFADSYYDLVRRNYKNYNYRIFDASANILAFAGIWDLWKDAANQEHYSFSIISIAADDHLKEIGLSRMPAILNDEESISNWLNYDLDFKEILNNLKNSNHPYLSFYTIADDINDSKNDFSELQLEYKI
jgi:putative SOS response-associated peptidase YedK